MNYFSSFRILAANIASIANAFRRTIILLYVLAAVSVQPVYAQDTILPLISNGGYMVDDGNSRHKYRENDLFTPASTMKLLTSLIALELFGPEYHFETHFFVDAQKNLYIKGYGDPLLTSEILLEISKRLAGMGIQQLQSICLDDSAFDLWGEMASEENSARSYDAPNGALAVNFNAVSIQVNTKGKISSGEPQTPFLPLMREIGAGLGPGLHRLNINVLPVKSGQTPALRYAGELFTAQLRQAGISLRQPWRIKKTPSQLTPILIHRGPANLAAIIQDCLKYSNNFVANQLFLACGIHTYGLPATWEKSRKTFTTYATTILHLPKGHLVIVEGAGLSRQNQFSPVAFIKVLKRFQPFASLLKQRDSIPLKSGTLTGVYCFAGYFPKGDTLIPFAILLNQTENTRNQLLKELQLATVGSTSLP